LIVAGDLRTALLTGLTASGLLIAFPADTPVPELPPGTSILLAVTGSIVLLSSLVDWYIILPRVSGLLGIRPCRHPDTDFPRSPKTWRETSRWWYIHRIVAALVLRFGISYAVVIAVAHQTSIPGGASIVGGAAAGSFASYLAAIPKTVWEAGHPSLIIGRTVSRSNIERLPRFITILGLRLKIPLLSRRVEGALRPRDYVYDVAVEGVQLVAADSREGELPLDEKDGSLVFERNPRKLKVRDIDASQPEPAEEPFHGCSGRCSGINWYCIENPRCFATK
jgi:hypothetical protein